MKCKKKGEQPLVKRLQSREDYDAVVSVFQSQNFTSDILTSSFAICQSIERLVTDGAGAVYINRGLFSNYYLKERLHGTLSERKRSVGKEASAFLTRFRNGRLEADYDSITGILDVLEYLTTKSGPDEYALAFSSEKLDAVAIVTSAENLDVMGADHAVPALAAVAALKDHTWVILTNGRLWRLYSAKTASASTNYFEINIESITDEKDPKLEFFVSLFGAAALVARQGKCDLDVVLEGGEQYAATLEEDLREKVFDKDLFLDLVRAVLDHKKNRKYDDEELADGKKKALKLLYRLLFILYAESRRLLPVKNQHYRQVSMGSVRERLAAMEKEPESQSAWKALSRLFRAISNGDREIGMPQYNGALFESDKELDRLDISNKYLVPALRALMEIDGKGIDYQNLGVRHLGSLYESLLEYSVKQATTELAVIKGEYIDMSFTKDLKARYDNIVDKGDVYLSAGGLARKGTGSYYTPDKIVRFLVKKGLEPIFADREKKFLEGLEKWRKTGDGAEPLTKQLLDIRVVDPAMGSGHFLVATVNEIAIWIAGLLDRHPDAPLAREIGEDRQRIIDEQAANGIEIDTELLTFNIILKRMVMKRCVYGVDINPLAVELAKLSLWLDSFTIGTPLTFLDHHMRAGDSLIGLWVGDLKSKRPDNATLDEWTDSIDSMGGVMRTVSYPADLNVEEVKRSKENYLQGRKASKPLRTLLSMKAAGIIDEELEKKMPRNLPMVVEAVRTDRLDKLVGGEQVKKAIEYSEKYQFFHWEFEFPDAFMDEREGFDLVVMNPPWEAVKPEDDDFFSSYYPEFRRLKSKPEKEKVKQKLLKEKTTAIEFQDYVERIEDRVEFYKLSEQYVKRGGGDTDLWKLFLERSFLLLAAEGTLSLVLPSGIVTNEGAKELRKELLERKIQCLYEFENKNGIFADVHRSYKFALVVCTNTPSAAEFPAAFYLHDTFALDGNVERDKFVKISSEFVKLVSPESLTIPEIRVEKEREIFEKLYMNHPLLSKGIDNGRWTFAFVREMDRTNAAGLFDPGGKGWQLIEGKHFHQFISDYEKPIFTVKPEAGLKWTEKIREYGILNKQIHELPRLVFRNVARSTDARSTIAAIVPPRTFLPNSASIVVPRYKNELLLSTEYSQVISYILGLFNSFVFDFLIRRRVTMNLNFFYLEQTPIPEKVRSTIGQQIIKLSARLSAHDKKFDGLAKATDMEYGPLSMKEHLQFTAKLNALVAHHYGLTRPEYEYIINTFEGFEEDENLVNLTEITWDDRLIRKFNGEVRKRVLKYYDETAAEMKGEVN